MTHYEKVQVVIIGLILFMFGVALGAVAAALIEALRAMGG
jgi:hypothetical protein